MSLYILCPRHLTLFTLVLSPSFLAEFSSLFGLLPDNFCCCSFVRRICEADSFCPINLKSLVFFLTLLKNKKKTLTVSASSYHGLEISCRPRGWKENTSHLRNITKGSQGDTFMYHRMPVILLLS